MLCLNCGSEDDVMFEGGFVCVAFKQKVHVVCVA